MFGGARGGFVVVVVVGVKRSSLITINLEIRSLFLLLLFLTISQVMSNLGGLSHGLVM